MEIGNIVKATAGKEKGQLFVIVKFEENSVYLADGKRLKKDKPKKKSLKHVKLFGQEKLTQEELMDNNDRVNAKIRKFIKSKRREYVER